MGLSAHCYRMGCSSPGSTIRLAEAKAISTFRRHLACQEWRVRLRPASGREDRWLCLTCFATLHYPEG